MEYLAVASAYVAGPLPRRYSTGHTSRSTHAEREHAPNDVVGKVPVQSLKVSSVDRRTTIRGQTAKQCSGLQSAFDFFATAQSFRGAHI